MASKKEDIFLGEEQKQTSLSNQKEGMFFDEEKRKTSLNSNQLKREHSKPEEIFSLTQSLQDFQLTEKERIVFTTRLSRKLSENTNLSILELKSIELTDEELLQLASYIVANDNNSITHLILDSNRITDDGAQTIADILKNKNIALKVLSIADNAIGDIGITAIATELNEIIEKKSKNNFSLEILNLDFNKIGNQGAKALSKILEKTLCPLISISLNGNLIGIEGIQSLFKAIQHNDQILDLEVNGNTFEKNAAGPSSPLSTFVEKFTPFMPEFFYNTLDAFDFFSNSNQSENPEEVAKISRKIKKNQDNIKKGLGIFIQNLEEINLNLKKIKDENLNQIQETQALENQKKIVNYAQQVQLFSQEIEERIRKLELIYTTRTTDIDSKKAFSKLKENFKKFQKIIGLNIAALKKIFQFYKNGDDNNNLNLNNIPSIQAIIDNTFEPELSTTNLELIEAIEKNIFTVNDQNFKIEYSDLKVKEKLGKGAFGIVFKGDYLETPVAIKQLNLNKKDNAFYIELFQKEFNIMARLRNPHIIGLFGLSENPNGQPMIVMEYLDGGSLFNLLVTEKNKKPLSLAERHRFTIQTLLGLYFLHSRKILHRDLKTENIMLTGGPNPTLKLIDFGMSIQLKGTIEVTEIIAGNPISLAPELLSAYLQRKELTYSDFTDMYAFGGILYEIFMREVPYKKFVRAQNINDFFNHILLGNRDKLSVHAPQAYSNALHFCWSPKPEERPKAKKLLDEMKSDAVMQQINRN